MAARWHRVAFDVSVSDVDELEDVMAAHGWALDGEEPTVHDPDPGEAHRTHVQDLMFGQEVWDRLDDGGGRNPFAPPWGGGWLPGG
jgi:hypothetical protein